MNHNYSRTFLLLATMTGLFLAVGYLLGGRQGMVMAFGFSLISNLFSYWFSDTMVLKMYKAKAVDEHTAPELWRSVKRLSQAAGLPMPKLYIIDMPSPNAFATGRNPEKSAVAVSRSLMEMLSPAELDGVLAHELAHIKNRDMLTMTVAASIAGALSMFAQTAMLFGNSRDRNGGSALGALLLLILSPFIASLLQMAISRTREYKADAVGAKIAGSGQGLANALLRIHEFAQRRPLRGQPKHAATAHLFIINPFKGSFLQALFSTHPSVEERVQRLRRMH